MTPRYSETDKKQAMADVRQRLMKAAIQEFAQRGYDGANVNTISLNAGFAKGTIYNYFPSKMELMSAILEESGSAHFDFIAERIRKEADPILRVKRFFEAGFEFVEDDPARAQVLVSTLYGTHAEFKVPLYRVYQPMFQLVAEEILSPGIIQGVFRQMEPAETSRMIMTFYLGTASSVDESGKPQLNPGEVADFVLHAIRNDR
jgi:AcrR family transcriptional regulator